jgi:hypothetical protein
VGFVVEVAVDDGKNANDDDHHHHHRFVGQQMPVSDDDRHEVYLLKLILGIG